MIFICSYSNKNVGLAQELQRYLIRKKESFFLLLHPLTLEQERFSTFETYAPGELKKTTKSIASLPFMVAHYVRCVITTFLTLLIHGRQTSTCIIFSNIDALAAIVLRWIYRFKVVFVSTDFAPRQRFHNPLLNSIYMVSDRLAYRFSNAVWHMYPERGHLKKYKHRAPSFDVLDGNNFKRVKRLPLEQINPHRLIYIGSIDRDCRLEEAIDAVAALKPTFPKAQLDIISSGDPDYERRLKKMADEKNLNGSVIFHGQITSPDQYEPLLCESGLGLCLYEIDKGDLAWYGTPLKVYLYGACGLPSICSDTMGPYTREYIEKDGMGVMAKQGDLLNVLQKIFNDPSYYKNLRQKSIEWASKFDYEDKFEKYLGLIP